MSWTASGWAKKVIVCPNGKKITRSEKFLLLIIADYFNDQMRAAWVSVATMADDALMTKRMARYVLRSLEKKGVILTTLGGNREGKSSTNRYEFPGLEMGQPLSHGRHGRKASIGQPLPPKGEILAPKMGQFPAQDAEIAIAPKLEETRRNDRADLKKSASETEPRKVGSIMEQFEQAKKWHRQNQG